MADGLHNGRLDGFFEGHFYSGFIFFIFVCNDFLIFVSPKLLISVGTFYTVGICV